MCGIAGIFSKKQLLTAEQVSKLTTEQSHRGPDAEGIFISQNKSCGLGHRRLSILDLSDTANQPMTSHCGNYTMVFNGEIYNFQEIKTDLEKHQSYNWQTTSDTEIILEAFATWGKQFVYKLNGMFTIAVYDNKNDVLWLFRDRIGIKPLYYFWDKNTFAFGSELKSLAKIQEELGGFSVNKQAVHQFLRLGYIPSPNTIYTEVKKFPSASFAALSVHGLNIETYWDIRKKVSPEVISDEKEAKKELKSLLQDSIEKRLVSDVPFGTFLSGGIDSSTVTSIAQNVSEKPINTFSIGFDEAKYNEAVYAAKIAKHLGTNHHEFTVSNQDAIDKFDNIITAYDEPFADSSAIPTMLVSKLAKQHVTMTLSGDGGDEQFLGYGMYTWANRMNNSFVKAFRKPAAWLLSKSNNTRKRASEHFRYKDQNKIASHIFSVEQYFFSENELDTVLNSDYKSSIDLEENPKLLRDLSVAEKQAFFDLRYYLQDDLLVKVDRASMQYSLETRVPLLDHRVIEFSINLDEKLKVKNKESKYLLKQVLYDYVPKEYFDRPKWGFSIPIRLWLKNEFSYLRTQYLDEQLINNWGILNTKAVKELEKRYIAGEDYLFNKLWAIIMLNQWLEKHG